MGRPDYLNRTAKAAANLDSAGNPAPIAPYLHNSERFAGDIRRGVPRDPQAATVSLFAGGIDIPDEDADCILAYVYDLEDWILGALLGHINRGKKKMIETFMPWLMADDDVPVIPANEEGLITLITSRGYYMTIPEMNVAASAGLFMSTVRLNEEA